jgi:antibiotic biosynthesis monooxygenase (ABM) superfamily enzyme
MASSTSTSTASDLLLVFSETGDRVNENEFHDWYDNEHIPLRQAVPGFQSCIRLVQADGKSPTWGAIYNIESLAVLESQPYKNLWNTQSDREKQVLRNLALLDRRKYARNERAPVRTKESFKGLRQGQAVVLVSFDIAPEHADELHRWYEEEHIEMLRKVPGWLESRRFILQDAGVSGSGAEGYPSKPPKFLAMHYYESPDVQETVEWKEATSTPWRTRMMELVGNPERRIFTVYKTF